jgi:hypothetical protein
MSENNTRSFFTVVVPEGNEYSDPQAAQRIADHFKEFKLNAEFVTKDGMGLPRFRGGLRAWDQSIGLDVILSSCFEPFFGSARGGAILPSRPARRCGWRAQRRSRTAPILGAARRACP